MYYIALQTERSTITKHLPAMAVDCVHDRDSRHPWGQAFREVQTTRPQANQPVSHYTISSHGPTKSKSIIMDKTTFHAMQAQSSSIH